MKQWGAGGAVAFIDAPLVVSIPAGTQRLCEREVGRRYTSPWAVAVNSSNVATKGLGGVILRERLEAVGWSYEDGTAGPGRASKSVSDADYWQRYGLSRCAVLGAEDEPDRAAAGRRSSRRGEIGRHSDKYAA